MPSYLEEFLHISNDFTENKLVFLNFKPPQLGEFGYDLDQSLDDKGCQLRLGRHIIQNVVSYKESTGEHSDF